MRICRAAWVTRTRMYCGDSLLTVSRRTSYDKWIGLHSPALQGAFTVIGCNAKGVACDGEHVRRELGGLACRGGSKWGRRAVGTPSMWQRRRRVTFRYISTAELE